MSEAATRAQCCGYSDVASGPLFAASVRHDEWQLDMPNQPWQRPGLGVDALQPIKHGATLQQLT